MSREQALHIAILEDKIEGVTREVEAWQRGEGSHTCLDKIAKILDIELEDE